MKLLASILTLKDGTRVEVEHESDNRRLGLLTFMGKISRYANKGHRVLYFATDDITVYSEFKQQYPAMNIGLLEKEALDIDFPEYPDARDADKVEQSLTEHGLIYTAPEGSPLEQRRKEQAPSSGNTG